MRHAAVKLTFAIHEVVVLSGFTKHMLDYLVREQIFLPSGQGATGRGRRRLYAYEDVVLLRALRAICHGKGKIRNLKASLVALRAAIGSMSHGQRIDKLLFVEGDELCLRTGLEGGRQLRTGQMTFGFFVDMRALSADLAEVVSIDRVTGKPVLAPILAAKAEEERQRIWQPIKMRRSEPQATVAAGERVALVR